jgi:large subunit ribosomal protein L16
MISFMCVSAADIELPPEAERPLVAMEPMPTWHGVRPRKYPRQMHDIRGPELVNNQLLHKQYGIIVCIARPKTCPVDPVCSHSLYLSLKRQALTGIQLTINHINLIRTSVNHHLNVAKMFAVWRIEPPWKPVTKKV